MSSPTTSTTNPNNVTTLGTATGHIPSTIATTTASHTVAVAATVARRTTAATAAVAASVRSCSRYTRGKLLAILMVLNLYSAGFWAVCEGSNPELFGPSSQRILFINRLVWGGSFLSTLLVWSGLDVMGAMTPLAIGGANTLIIYVLLLASSPWTQAALNPLLPAMIHFSMWINASQVRGYEWAAARAQDHHAFVAWHAQRWIARRVDEWRSNNDAPPRQGLLHQRPGDVESQEGLALASNGNEPHPNTAVQTAGQPPPRQH